MRTCLSMSHFVLFCCIRESSFEGLLFSERKQRGTRGGKVDVEDKLGGMDGGETVVRINCMEQESIL